MNRQQVFNKVVKHMLEHGKGEINPQLVFGLHRITLLSPVGILIGRGTGVGEYRQGIGSSEVQQAMMKAGVDFSDPLMYDMIWRLQKMHREKRVEEWRDELERIAEENSLDSEATRV